MTKCKVLRHIDFSDPPNRDGWEIPQEVLDYAREHGYGEKMIPLDLENCRKIFDILHEEIGNV